MTLAACAALIVATLRVAWVDCRRWQIEYETLACVAVACAWLRVAEDGLVRTGLVAAMAVAVIGIVALAVRIGLLRRPGDGDWPLLAVCFFLAIDHLLVFGAVLVPAGLFAAVVYSRARRRRLFRSRFPLAPPALLAAVTAFFARGAMPGGF